MNYQNYFVVNKVTTFLLGFIVKNAIGLFYYF